MAEFLKIIVKPSEEEDPDKWMVDMELFLSNGIPRRRWGERNGKGSECRHGPISYSTETYITSQPMEYGGE